MNYGQGFFKHGCSEEVADHVIAYGLWYQLHDSPNGNEQVMYVGWDMEGNHIWEIGVELYVEGLEDWVFHAQVATSFSRKKVRL